MIENEVRGLVDEEQVQALAADSDVGIVIVLNRGTHQKHVAIEALREFGIGHTVRFEAHSLMMAAGAL